jgi:dihydroorotate dehydrogenase (fumarate)
MDLSTRYLGLELPHPFMPGASPLVDDLDTVRRLEDAGASAIVMNSLFEEQVVYEQESATHFMDNPAYSFAEAQTYFPEPEPLSFGPEEYLQKLLRVVEAVDLPVIGSLNGTTKGRWLEFAKLIQDTGAAALELNVYALPTDPEESAAAIEARTVDIVREVKKSISVPLSVKLSPYYTAPVHLAKSLEGAGADGLVLFNRFYQPDIDPEELEVSRSLRLSNSDDLLLRLRWLAILSGRVELDLAVTGGIHTPVDAIKATMAGADAIQMTSALLKNGPEYLAMVRRGVATWLIEHDYDSLAQARGSMNHLRSPDPAGYERANYMDILKSWKAQA